MKKINWTAVFAWTTIAFVAFIMFAMTVQVAGEMIQAMTK
jgi:F0F1-type ATP synthase membrane subunit b/b'